MKYLYTIICAALCCSFTAQIYFPPSDNDSWETITPEEIGWCEDEIDELIQFLDESDTKAFILLKDGKMVVEHYSGTFTQDSLWQWNSAGKSVTSFLVGLAQEQGYLDISQPTSQYLGNGWTACTAEQEQQITVLNQLTMTSGLDDGVDDIFCTDPECLLYLQDANTRWAYHNAPYTLLDEVLSAATSQTLNTFFIQQLRNPIGMNGFYVPIDFNNVLFSNARSMARFGLLALAEGNWNGQQIMTDPEYFNAMIAPSQNLNKSYGYLWWLNGQESFMIPQSQFVFDGMLTPNAPAEMYSAVGKDGQFINVVPSQGIVLVRMGLNPGSNLVPITYNNDLWAYLQEIFCNQDLVLEKGPSQLTVFPNPACEKIVVQCRSEIETMTMCNAMGQTVLVMDSNLQGTGRQAIDISTLQTGAYTLHVTTANETLTTTFLKE